MIPLSKEPVEWRPEWLDEDKRPTFLLRPGDVFQRAALEAELAGDHGAGPVFSFHLAAEFERGVVALLQDSPEDAARILEWHQAEGLEDTEKEALASAKELVREHWPAYRQLIAKDERRNHLLPLVAFRRFCAGWNGPDLPAFAKGADGLVTAECMAKVPPLMLRNAGIHAYGLLYAAGEAKN